MPTFSTGVGRPFAFHRQYSSVMGPRNAWFQSATSARSSPGRYGRMCHAAALISLAERLIGGAQLATDGVEGQVPLEILPRAPPERGPVPPTPIPDRVGERRGVANRAQGAECSLARD